MATAPFNHGVRVLRLGEEARPIAVSDASYGSAVWAPNDTQIKLQHGGLARWQMPRADTGAVVATTAGRWLIRIYARG